MVACAATRRLYIADLSNNCVWRIDLDSADSDRTAHRMASGIVRPFSLSLRAGRLLVTSYNRLSVLDEEGHVLKQVRGPLINRGVDVAFAKVLSLVVLEGKFTVLAFYAKSSVMS